MTLAIGLILAILALFIIRAFLGFLLERIGQLSVIKSVALLAVLGLIAVSNRTAANSNSLAIVGVTASLLVLLIYLAFEIYVSLYFRSKKFRKIRNSIQQYTMNCNDLNEHIEELKLSYTDVASIDYGDGRLYDNSNFKMNRSAWAEQTKNRWTHNCSASVLKHASDQPFKYMCKYFDIKTDEATLSDFERTVNNFSAAEQGKVLLKKERDAIIASIGASIPALILKFKRERVVLELGFNKIDFSDLYFPVYTFRYVSAGGNSSSKFDIKFDIQNLDKFIGYLSHLVKFRNSVAGQRALMTSMLREKIKHRDNFTCKICSLSIADETHLLLEIDHIIPLSKGGVTSEENLQTLCWRCNRSKGSKIRVIQ